MLTDTTREEIARAMCKSGGVDPDFIMGNDGPRWRYYLPLVEEIEPIIARLIAEAEDRGLERAAAVADNHSYALDIKAWSRMTKKEHGAYACRSVAASIRALKTKDAANLVSGLGSLRTSGPCL